MDGVLLWLVIGYWCMLNYVFVCRLGVVLLFSQDVLCDLCVCVVRWLQCLVVVWLVKVQVFIGVQFFSVVLFCCVVSIGVCFWWVWCDMQLLLVSISWVILICWVWFNVSMLLVVLVVLLWWKCSLLLCLVVVFCVCVLLLVNIISVWLVGVFLFFLMCQFSFFLVSRCCMKFRFDLWYCMQQLCVGIVVRKFFILLLICQVVCVLYGLIMFCRIFSIVCFWNIWLCCFWFIVQVQGIRYR